jgi:hypothetical protein
VWPPSDARRDDSDGHDAARERRGPRRASPPTVPRTVFVDTVGRVHVRVISVGSRAAIPGHRGRVAPDRVTATRGSPHPVAFIVLYKIHTTVRHRIGTLAVAVLLVTATFAGTTGTAAALKYTEIGEPTIETTVDGSNVVRAGETTTLAVTLRNSGQTVTTLDGPVSEFERVVRSQSLQPGAALSTTATVRSGSAPVTVRTGEQSVGVVAPDSTTQVPVEVEVNESAAPGTYRLPVEVSYRHVNTVLADGDETYVTYSTETVRTHVVVRVESSARLAVVSLTGDGLAESADGRIEATVRNAGSGVASDATLRLHGREWLTPRTSEAGLGDLAPGEEATAQFRVGVGDVAAGDHAVGLSMHYEDDNGVVAETPVRTGSVRVGEGPQFDVTASGESLYVDSAGAVRLTVQNVGDDPAEDVRVHLRESPPLTPVSGAASLGDLASGESADARLRVEVGDRALAGSYPLTVVVERDDAFGDPVQTDPLTAGVQVGPERTVETGSAGSIPAGSTSTVEFTVRNTGDAPMRDAVVRLNADSPFETDDDTAYVGDLAPGEEATVQFTVSADGAATPKAYALDTTVAFDNAFGSRVVTDVESTELRVEAGGGGPLAALLDLLGL